MQVDFTLILAVFGSIGTSLCAVIAYLYKQQQQQQAVDRQEFKERLAERDGRIKELQETIIAMQARLDQVYLRFVERIGS